MPVACICWARFLPISMWPVRTGKALPAQVPCPRAAWYQTPVRPGTCEPAQASYCPCCRTAFARACVYVHRSCFYTACLG